MRLCFLPSKPSQPLEHLIACYHAAVGYKPTETEYSAQANGPGGPDRWDQPDRNALDVERRADGQPDVPADRRGPAGADRVWELKPGQQLETEIELRERYGASRNTVRDAIKLLTTLSLVETRPGQGTFVVNKIDPFVTTLSGDPSRAWRYRGRQLPVGSD